jgi:hypothetical protein
MATDGLTPRQRRFIEALLVNPTIDAAAAAVGISRRTGTRWMGRPAVRAALAAALDEALGVAVRVAVRSMPSAVATLHRIHTDPDVTPGARVSAARAILDAGPKLYEANDLAERVAALEAKTESEQ